MGDIIKKKKKVHLEVKIDRSCLSLNFYGLNVGETQKYSNNIPWIGKFGFSSSFS